MAILAAYLMVVNETAPDSAGQLNLLAREATFGVFPYRDSWKPTLRKNSEPSVSSTYEVKEKEPIPSRKSNIAG